MRDMRQAERRSVVLRCADGEGRRPNPYPGEGIMKASDVFVDTSPYVIGHDGDEPPTRGYKYAFHFCIAGEHVEQRGSFRQACDSIRRVAAEVGVARVTLLPYVFMNASCGRLEIRSHGK